VAESRGSLQSHSGSHAVADRVTQWQSHAVSDRVTRWQSHAVSERVTQWQSHTVSDRVTQWQSHAVSDRVTLLLAEQRNYFLFCKTSAALNALLKNIEDLDNTSYFENKFYLMHN
jgi:hypothetical protein